MSLLIFYLNRLKLTLVILEMAKLLVNSNDNFYFTGNKLLNNL